MDVLVISVLILLGIFFCVLELLLLPGITIGGILSVASYGGAIYMSFGKLGPIGGVIVIVVIIVLSAVALFFSLRARTWDRFSLKDQIESSTTIDPKSILSVGVQGVAISRLAPMGKVMIDGNNYEAKSIDVYIDVKSTVEVVGFENSSIIVKKVN